MRARFRAAMERRLTREMVDHALDLGLPGRRPFDDGDLQNRIRSEATHLPRYPETLLRIGTGILTAAGSLVALLYVHWVFVAVALGGVGAVTLLMRRLMGTLTAGQTAHDELNSRMVNAYTGALAGRRTIRAAGTLEREVERITRPLPDLADKTREILESFGRGAVTVTSANHVVLTVTAVTGVCLLAAGDLTVGALMAAIRYAQMTYSSVAGVLDNGWFQIAFFRAHAARTLAVLRSPAAVPEPRSAASGAAGARRGQDRRRISGCAGKGSSPARGSPRTRRKDGCAGRQIRGWQDHACRADRPASGPGQRVHSHRRYAGCRNVARRALAPGGLRIRTARALRRHNPRRDRAGRRNHAREEVRAAAGYVEADAFIERLPKGYDTPLGDAPMSGGEHQRLGLARAALRDTPILILDDALSSLDVATEARVLAALRKLGASRTTVVIAHRASTAAAADLVAWLYRGEVRRVAPHIELWRDPAYRAAFQGDPAQEAAS